MVGGKREGNVICVYVSVELIQAYTHTDTRWYVSTITTYTSVLSPRTELEEREWEKRCVIWFRNLAVAERTLLHLSLTHFLNGSFFFPLYPCKVHFWEEKCFETGSSSDHITFEIVANGTSGESIKHCNLFSELSRLLYFLSIFCHHQRQNEDHFDTNV